jgi:hypothetical protein
MLRPGGSAAFPRARAAVPWRRRLRAGFTERLGLKGTALLIALVLWVIVSLREPTEDVLPVRLVPLLPADVALDGPAPVVRVLVRGMGRDILKLHQSVPVLRRRVPSTDATALTLELSPRDVSLPPGIEATVEEVQPSAVLLHLRRLPRAAPVVRDTVDAAEARSEAGAREVPALPDTVRRDSSARPAAAHDSVRPRAVTPAGAAPALPAVPAR